VWVSERLYNLGYGPKVSLAGLLHDAAEAYMGDMIRPLKYGEVGAAYLTAEARLEAEIAKHFNVDYPFHPAIHEADNHVLLNVELPEDGARWTHNSTPDVDREAFLQRFRKLSAEIDAL
jgi:hypothetical protein